MNHLPPHEPSASRPTVFLSYAHEDAAFAQQLIADLDAAGHACWIDTSSLKGGDEWMIAIAEGISASYASLVLVTQRALEVRFHCRVAAFELRLYIYMMHAIENRCKNLLHGRTQFKTAVNQIRKQGKPEGALPLCCVCARRCVSPVRTGLNRAFSISSPWPAERTRPAFPEAAAP
jgi:TIR domain